MLRNGNRERVPNREKLLLWLIIIAEIVLFVIPAERLLTPTRYVMGSLTLPPASSDLEPVTLGESRHFRVSGPIGYMTSAEVTTFLMQAEDRRAKLIAYLEIPDKDSQIALRLHPQRGVDRSIGEFEIDLYAVKAGQNGLVHELTHFLMGNSNPLPTEGLAAVMQDRFGLATAFPDYGLPVDAWLYATMRSNDLPPLSEIWKLGRSWNQFDPEASRVRFLEAASFSSYIISSYGLETFLQFYGQNQSQLASNSSLEQWERQWVRILQWRHVGLAVILVISGITVLCLAHLAIDRGGGWPIPTTMGWLTFAAWSAYLIYFTLPVAILVAIVAGVIVSRRRRRLGEMLLWLFGSGSLLALVIVPPLQNLVKSIVVLH